MRIAYFDCFAGVSGDMIIGSLLDSGLKLKDLKGALSSLKIRGLRVSSRVVRRQGLRGMQFIVELKNTETFRNLDEVEKRLNKTSLSQDIKEDALKIFTRIERAEARAHGLRKTHFHEIGDCDTIVDIVGSLWGLKRLGIREVYTSPIPLGSGLISTHHGYIPIPAPATVELLKGYPVSGTHLHGELTTPTGAAILSFLSKGTEVPYAWKLLSIGSGAGTRESEIPNLLRLFIGEREDVLREDEVAVLETNIDNMDPQGYELAMERLFEAGALDVFLTNIIMKKGRPGQKLTVLSEKEKIDAVTKAIFENVPTLGVRVYRADRKKLHRKTKSFRTPWGVIKIKEIKNMDGSVLRVPESDEVIRLARAKSMSYEKTYKKILDMLD